MREKKAVRMERAINEIMVMIRERYPEAEFCVRKHMPESVAIWLEVYTQEDDAWDVIEMTGDRLVDFLVGEHISLNVLPLPYDRRPSLQAAQRQPKPKSA